MITRNFAGNINNTQKILTSFATAQLTNIDTVTVKDNTFNLFVITTFFNGAMTQLGKQSTLPKQLQYKYLHGIICDNFNLPQHNAEGLVSSISRMMNKYYFLENIYNEGYTAAEKWLNSDTIDCTELGNLLHNYKGFTMLDMNSAGLKEGFNPAQQAMSSPPLKGTKNKKHSFHYSIALVILISVTLSSVYYYFL
ncbi:MAG: hypothetical protein GXP08_15740 [Gammaproteobacteria bacterium]|nr:hypothetical protein [Gammaproteobacteria bacterium]